MGKYKICVYAICKNEEKFVDRWIESMSEADQIIVTDTGSTDRTVKKLRKKGAIVYKEKIDPWRFDVARNKSLGHVPDDTDICVCTDLDELFEKGWREKLEANWHSGVHMANYLYNWSLKPDGSPDVQFTYFKVHTKKDYVWSYPIHECLSYIGKVPEVKVFVDGMILNHYPDSSKSRGSYIELLELAVKENPESDRMTYYLGREYMYKCEWQKCIDTLKKHLSLKSAVWKEERCASMRWIAQSYYNLSNVKECYGWYFRAIAECAYMRDAYVEFAKVGYCLSDWITVFYLVEEALKIKNKSNIYVNMGYSWNETLDDLGAISCYWLGMYDKSLKHAKIALSYNPNDERLKNNLLLIQQKIESIEKEKNNTISQVITTPQEQKLIHTLLFMIRKDKESEDINLAEQSLHSLEKGSYKTVIVFNQGYYTNKKLKEFLSQFKLNCIILGEGTNTGTVVGRQSCFEYIWKNNPETQYISELHIDMIFTYNWEDPLVEYLDNNDDGLISCGIIDKNAEMFFINTKTNILPSLDKMDEFLQELRRDKIVHGFTNPCIHTSNILKETGGYNSYFLRGKQCFEDDSMLLGYYYYFGTKRNWKPKVNYNSVVYHAVAGQRIGLNDNIQINLDGLIKQYGAIGMKHLSKLHKSKWHINFFNEQYKKIKGEL